ncbi:MAG: CBS domain-containing protein [Candidatus Abyssobacteria bacterium SURF_17]|uniref:CBS domain-containing protein n=1 Tax=Candidatus Abyssobacteria bacterium SURF_17 TaxID=2093361 RepID=A0A419ET90_9BACT|nr:MAG: CBS domain-containing protein [Candidatus Abyssubacteria bacterium SURF_17]
MEMKCVGDIMMPLEAFPYIPYWFTLRQALAEMEDAGVRRPNQKPMPWLILVFSARNQLLGIVRQHEILQGLRSAVVPERLKNYYPTSAEVTADFNLFRLGFSAERAIQELRSQLERQIIEFMIPIQATVDHDDPMLLAIYLMIDRGLTFVPVVRDGQIVGLVYAEDVLHEVIGHIV